MNTIFVSFKLLLIWKQIIHMLGTAVLARGGEGDPWTLTTEIVQQSMKLKVKTTMTGPRVRD